MDKYDVIDFNYTQNTVTLLAERRYSENIGVKSMKNNIHEFPVETREILGCKIKLFFTDAENKKVKSYVLNNLMDSFEKRHNILPDPL